MSKDERTAVGHRIRMARERAGLDREGLAAKVGVHSGSIARWETGGSVPHAFTMERIAETCGVTADWLRTGRGETREVAAATATGEETGTGDVFASLDHVARFVEGIAPPGQERLRKLDALEGLRRMLTARGALPDWWYPLRERVENGQV
jgi:transcriptional regulator with XRE-family HTH domain